jgi:MFS family permease
VQNGAWLHRIAQPWLALELGAGGLELGLLAVVQFTPILGFSLASGAIADRVPRRRLLAATYLSSLGLSIGIALLTLSGRVELWHVYVYSLGVGAVTAFDGPARQALLAEAVGAERIQRALGLDQAMFSAARVIAPAIAGVVISLWGVGWCFALNAVSVLPALVTLMLMRLTGAQPGSRERRPLWSEAVEGIRYALADPLLRMPLVVLLFVGLFGYNIGIWLPLFARDVLDAGPAGFGTMNVAIGAGSLVAAVRTGMGGPPSPVRIAASAAAFGVLLAATALAPSLAVALAILVVAGFMSIVFTVSTSVALQIRTDDRYRGRVMSLYFLLFAGTTPLGSAITGVLADVIGVRATVAILGGMCVLGAALGLLWLRKRADARSVYRGMQTDS